MNQNKFVILTLLFSTVLLKAVVAQTFTYGDREIKTVMLDGKSVVLNRAVDNVTKRAGIVDKNTGKVIIAFDWHRLLYSPDDEIFECEDTTTKVMQFFNFQGKSLYKGKTFNFPKTHLGDEIGRTYAVYRAEKNGLLGLINTNGKLVVPCEFKSIIQTDYENDIWKLKKPDGSNADFYGNKEELVVFDKNAPYKEASFYKPVNISLEQLKSTDYWYATAEYANDKAPLIAKDAIYDNIENIFFEIDEVGGAKKLFSKLIKKPTKFMYIRTKWGKDKLLKGTNIDYKVDIISLEGRMLKVRYDKKSDNYYEIVDFVPNEKILLKRLGNDGAACAECSTTVYTLKK